jgi:hypothetical protein
MAFNKAAAESKTEAYTLLPHPFITIWARRRTVLHCAHRATTASSWGLCEQEGWWPARPSHTVSTILPKNFLLSMSSCAARAS